MKLNPLQQKLIIDQADKVEAAKKVFEKEQQVMIEKLQLVSGIQDFSQWKLENDQLTITKEKEGK